MAEYIDLNEAIIDFGFEWDDIAPTRDEFINFLKSRKRANVKEIVYGRWLGWGKGGTPTYENYGTCSVCGEDSEIYTEHRNYCPNCGAEMSEVVE